MQKKLTGIFATALLTVTAVISLPAQASGLIIASAYVPNVVGSALPDADRQLRNWGLITGTVTQQHSESAIAGEVISQDPAICSNCLPAGSPVDLVISSGPEHIPATGNHLSVLIGTIQAMNLEGWVTYWLTWGLNLATTVWDACQSSDYSEFENNGYSSFIAGWCGSDQGAGFATAILERFMFLLDFASGKNGFPFNVLTDGQADVLRVAAQEALDDLHWVPRASLQSIVSNGVDRDYYLIVPDNYSQFAEPLPIIFLAHGTNGTWANWLEVGGFYGTHMIDAVGDEAIIVLLQADVISSNIFQWDRDIDIEYFEDVLQDVAGLVNYDADRVFAHGHSSGGGYTHEIGCRAGDKVRGIAPSAGSLILFSCIGSTAVMQLQSEFDTVVAPTLVEPGVDVWALYNGFEPSLFTNSPEPYCEDYSQGGGADYPVIYCLHSETANNGHRWWEPQGELIWSFFTGLSDVGESTEHPPGGGNGKIIDGLGSTANFTLSYPAGIGTVYRLAMVLYPANTRQPLTVAPIFFLNSNIEPQGATAGTSVTYSVPISLPEAFPFPYDFTATVMAYVVGGSFPQGTSGLEHIALRDITIENATDPIVIEGTWELEPLY